MWRALFLTLLLVSHGCACRPPFRVKADADVNVNAKVETPPAKMEGPLYEMPVIREGDRRQKIALIDIDGVLINANHVGIYSAGENPVDIFRERLDAIEQDGCFKAVILRINSPGGSVTASDMMDRDLAVFKQKTGLPVVACIMDVGAGGAYLLASGADRIVAHPTSITGGLGVIINIYDMSTTLENAVQNISIQVGKNIELGSAFPHIGDNDKIADFRERQRAILEPMAHELHHRLVNNITSRRAIVKGPDEDPFDGRIYSTSQAQQTGLVDQSGYIDDAICAARELSGCKRGCVVMLHRKGDKARTPYAITPNEPVSATVFPSLPGLDRDRVPQFLYIWQPDATLARR